MPIQRAKPRFTEVKNFSITGTDLPAGSVLQVQGIVQIQVLRLIVLPLI
jgi:hypothetical protein